MRAYGELYVSDNVETQGLVFLLIRDELPGVDEKWFIESYMKSRVRSWLDRAAPKYVGMPPVELILTFIEDECNGEYKRGEEWGGFLPQWVGLVYSMYQWKYNISSKELIKILPLSEMERVFPVLHQAGLECAIDKIHDEVLGLGE